MRIHVYITPSFLPNMPKLLIDFPLTLCQETEAGLILLMLREKKVVFPLADYRHGEYGNGKRSIILFGNLNTSMMRKSILRERLCCFVLFLGVLFLDYSHVHTAMVLLLNYHWKSTEQGWLCMPKHDICFLFSFVFDHSGATTNSDLT